MQRAELLTPAVEQESISTPLEADWLLLGEAELYISTRDAYAESWNTRVAGKCPIERDRR